MTATAAVLCSLIAQCTERCGLGLQTRIVLCVTVSDSVLEIQPDSLCNSSRKLIHQKECKENDCPVHGLWFVGAFQEVRLKDYYS